MYKIKEYQLFRDEDKHPYLKVKRELDYETNIFKDSIDIARLMVDLYSMHEFFVEHSYVIGFNCSDEILGIIELGQETDTQVHMSSKILFMSLLLMGANKFVILHNHPNNINEPSTEDINLGSTVKLGAHLLDMQFVDQLIICEEEFYSMAQNGLM